MENWTVAQKWRYGVMRSLGLGFLAGGAEVVGLAFQLPLQLDPTDFLVMGAVAIPLMGALAGGLATITGALHLVTRTRQPHRMIALQMGLAGGGLFAWHLWQAAFEVWLRGQPIPATSLALMPIGFGGVIFYNALYWLKKVHIGKSWRLGWTPGSLLVALGFLGLASAVADRRDTGGGFALASDPNVLIIALDSVRRDHIRAYAPGETLETGNISHLSKQGLLFEDAVSPTSSTRAALATILTGLHPLRHEVISDHHVLSSGLPTVTEVMESEGWATGAFVSHLGVRRRSGIDQGFRIYDDDFSPVAPGLARINGVGLALQAAQGLGIEAAKEGQLSRSGAETVDRFTSWLADHHEVPFLALVHLADARPRVAADPAERDVDAMRATYRAGVEEVDVQVGRILAALDVHHLRDDVPQFRFDAVQLHINVHQLRYDVP